MQTDASAAAVASVSLAKPDKPPPTFLHLGEHGEHRVVFTGEQDHLDAVCNPEFLTLLYEPPCGCFRYTAKQEHDAVAAWCGQLKTMKNTLKGRGDRPCSMNIVVQDGPIISPAAIAIPQQLAGLNVTEIRMWTKENWTGPYRFKTKEFLDECGKAFPNLSELHLLVCQGPFPPPSSLPRLRRVKIAHAWWDEGLYESLRPYQRQLTSLELIYEDPSRIVPCEDIFTRPSPTHALSRHLLRHTPSHLTSFITGSALGDTQLEAFAKYAPCVKELVAGSLSLRYLDLSNMGWPVEQLTVLRAMSVETLGRLPKHKEGLKTHITLPAGWSVSAVAGDETSFTNALLRLPEWTFKASSVDIAILSTKSGDYHWLKTCPSLTHPAHPLSNFPSITPSNSSNMATELCKWAVDMFKKFEQWAAAAPGASFTAFVDTPLTDELLNVAVSMSSSPQSLFVPYLSLQSVQHVAKAWPSFILGVRWCDVASLLRLPGGAGSESAPEWLVGTAVDRKVKQSFAEYVSRQLPGMLKAGRRVNMKNIINSLSRLTRMDVQEYVNQHLQASMVPVFMARYDIARADGEVEIGVNHSVASTANFSTLQPTARTITAVSNTYDVLRDQKTPTRTLRVGLLDFMMVGVLCAPEDPQAITAVLSSNSSFVGQLACISGLTAWLRNVVFEPLSCLPCDPSANTIIFHLCVPYDLPQGVTPGLCLLPQLLALHHVRTAINTKHLVRIVAPMTEPVMHALRYLPPLSCTLDLSQCGWVLPQEEYAQLAQCVPRSYTQWLMPENVAAVLAATVRRA